MKKGIGLSASALGAVLLGLYYFSPRDEGTTRAPAVTTLQAPAPPLPAPLPAPETRAVPAAVAPKPSLPPLDAEQLLRELEVLSVSDKPLALSRALEADARLSPMGVMAEARRALIVTLMVDTGRMPEARERARAFIRQYPESPYRPLVQGTTGVHPRPTPSELRDAR